VNRLMLAALVLGAAGVCFAGEPPSSAAPVEFAVLGAGKTARIVVQAEVDGKPLSTIWDETFDRMFAFFDRNGDGALDTKEAALVPPPLALRQAMSNGFTPPSGPAPPLSEIDRDGDGKVSLGELARLYRGAGLGNVLIGVGRIPAGAEVTAALLKRLDADADGRVTEKECTAAADALKNLDRNDDELIGAGELVPKAVYPGAAGTTLLTPPTAEGLRTEVLTKLPLIQLPADERDTQWVAEILRRGDRDGKRTGAELAAWREEKPDARWVVKLGDKQGGGDPFGFVAGRVRVEGWTTEGRMPATVAAARKQLAAQFDTPAVPADTNELTRPRGVGLAWLTPIADRDGDGKLARKELDAWLDLQEQIARGQVFMTLLDAGTGLFEILDTNHDGALSVRELRGAWERVREVGCVSAGAVAKFPRVLLAAVSRGYPQPFGADRRRGPQWFRAMDRNGDGDVSRREFNGPADVFNRLDADGDGLLRPEEADKARKESGG
jgi:Ca2+-binding EF-hand superfamily protein